MKKFLLFILAFIGLTAEATITNVTSRYVTNPDFGARYAGWYNQAATKGTVGGFLHQTNSAFEGKSGEVYMEKWVSPGGNITACNMYQHLKGLPSGTYTLVVSAYCGKGSGSSYTHSTGGYIYAQDQETAVSGAPGDHSVVFCVGDDGKATIGIRSRAAQCNWMAFDNVRLYYNDEGSADSLAARQAIVDAERQRRADIEAAGSSAAVVTTYPFVASGITIALIRATFTMNGATTSERGVCWSSEHKEPTILDDCTTEYFNNKGFIYRLEGLSPAKGYWARPYVITGDGKVSYGETIKFYTERRGNTNYVYDYQAQVESASQIAWDYNINSGIAETVWMYNQLAFLSGLYLNVHYVRGAGAGSGTADCSYGGWMRVSQATAYQQTGTMLHETNHGVGVGTTSEWYNNSNLRENTTWGRWLGPCATKMVRFLENNDAAFLTGDGTHMWATTSDGSSLTYGYGINGTQEDSYNPSNQLLYFGNILVTHSLHHDGLISTSGAGITSSYTFMQDDEEVYYIKPEGADYGFGDRFIGYRTSQRGSRITRTFGSVQRNFSDIEDDPYFQWHITYLPNFAMYVLQNVGSGAYIRLSGTSVSVSTSTPDENNRFMLLPAREDITYGELKTTGYWIVRGNAYGSQAIRAIGSEALELTSLTSATFDHSNTGGESQRFLFLTKAQAEQTPTGINSIYVSNDNATHMLQKDGKYLENNRIIIRKNGIRYQLDGKQQ